MMSSDDTNWKGLYYELLDILRIHHSHTHADVIRYAHRHMDELRSVRSLRDAVQRFHADIHEAGLQ